VSENQLRPTVTPLGRFALVIDVNDGLGLLKQQAGKSPAT
jgi:hypothetical protein